MTAHFFTVDVEEHFQVSAFDRTVSRDDWPNLSGRLHHTVPLILERLDRVDAKGTFFVLGWVARHRADVVRAIARAGHEIASHGYWHHRVNTRSPEHFREDVRASKAEIEDVTGAKVQGYRAPSFSIVPGCEWAFDILLEEGFIYDSSIFPVRRSGYGYAGAPRIPHLIKRQAGTLHEFPLATTQVAGVTIPAAGGGYLRHFPERIIHRAFAEASRQGVCATFYLHPWEVDPGQPRMPVGLLTRLRHYRGLDRALDRVERLLDAFPFTSIGSFLRDKDSPAIGAEYQSPASALS